VLFGGEIMKVNPKHTFRKGRKKELLARDELEKNGHTILFKSQWIRFGHIDFGPHYKNKEIQQVATFDIVSYKDGQLHFFSIKNSETANVLKETGRIKTYMNAFPVFSELASQVLHGERIDAGTCHYYLWCWHKPRWRGRGKEKHWEPAHWDKTEIR
jgi:hypothetical protein